MRSLYLALILIFASAPSHAEIPSFDEFKANFKMGKLNCNLNRFLEKAGMTNHEAFEKRLSKAEMQERFKRVFTETIYEGIQQTQKINPKLAELIANNSMKFSARYRCDYTSLRGKAGAYVKKRFIYFGKKSMNLGLATLVLFSEHPNYGLNNKIDELWMKRVLYHEHLHTHLHPNEKKFVLHKRKSKQIFFGDDLVYSISNHAFRVPVKYNQEIELPLPIYSELFREPITHQKFREKVAHLPMTPSPHVYTLQQCATAYLAYFEDGQLLFNFIDLVRDNDAATKFNKACNDNDFNGGFF